MKALRCAHGNLANYCKTCEIDRLKAALTAKTFALRAAEQALASKDELIAELRNGNEGSK